MDIGSIACGAKILSPTELPSHVGDREEIWSLNFGQPNQDMTGGMESFTFILAYRRLREELDANVLESLTIESKGLELSRSLLIFEQSFSSLLSVLLPNR